MQLLKLTANKPGFNTILFNERGISIIAAIKETDDPRKTYNSVGKSLSIKITHFCLGANLTSDFANKLNDWEFSLDFKIANAEYKVTRSVSNAGYVKLNDKDYTLSDFKDLMLKLVFRVPENSKFISFRGLISRFIRPKKNSYVNYDSFILEESMNPVAQLMNNGFLLGLDTNRILKKYELKENLDKLNDLKKQLNNPEFRSLFQSEKDEDIEISIVELEFKIEKIKANLDNFQVAEDYHQVRKEADDLSDRLRTLKNQASKLNNALVSIDKSLTLRPDISKDDLLKLYDEAKVQLGESVIKRLSDLEIFNKKLLENRILNLVEERNNFTSDLQKVERTIKNLGGQMDEKLKYLNTHGALEEFTKMNQILSDHEKKLEKLTNYKRLLNDYKNKLQELKKEFSDENIATNKYLADTEPVIKKNIVLFKSFSDRFYHGKISGITVDNNEGNNKVRFDIRAKIEDDAGDAVNEVKIFCFDWTLLKGQYNHGVKFIYHDSRITDGMDTRQVKSMFEIAEDECQRNNFQYIISLNQNVIDLLRTEMIPEDFERQINSRVVLRLSDKSAEQKLLGIQIDLDYETD